MGALKQEQIDKFWADGVLVVEDAPDVRETLCEMLQLGGYQVESLDSGSAALNRLMSDGPKIDLVLSDVVMPKMGGFELATQMEKRGSTVPICLVSGYAAKSDGDGDTRKIPRITKPFSLADLLDFVGEQIASSALQSEHEDDVIGSA